MSHATRPRPSIERARTEQAKAAFLNFYRGHTRPGVGRGRCCAALCPCSCTERESGHRTWRCATCQVTTLDPPCLRDGPAIQASLYDS